MAFDYDYIKNLDESGKASVRGDIRAKLEQAQAKWDALTAECDQLRAALAAVTAERDKLAAALRWIPVGERLPEAPAWVLVYADGAMNCMWYYKGEWSDATAAAAHNIVISDITHWRPLPPPPPALEK